MTSARPTHAPTRTRPPAKAAPAPVPVFGPVRRAPPRNVLGIGDLEGHIHAVLATAHELKAQAAVGKLPPLLAGKTVLVVFERSSTRTRISFEVGIQKLGGVCSILDAATSQLGRGESIEDTAAVLSRYADAIVYRSSSHANLTEMARHATVPVVNALTDLEHPCQVLADWMTMEEHLGPLAGKTFTYVGDGNNMCHSYLLAAPLVGMDVRVACPAGYGPDWGVVEQAEANATRAGTDLLLTPDPVEAVQGAHAVATDTWVSMGDEQEEAQRLRDFAGYRVDDELMDHAAPGARFLHCLPGHWGQEATHEVAHGPRSVIYDQAENRMWVQMALLVHLLA